MPKKSHLSHSFSKAGLSPDCQLVYLLNDNKIEVYKYISRPTPQHLTSMNHHDKLPWQCAAISNNFLVAANRETFLLWELGYSEKIEVVKLPIGPPWGINCLAIHEDVTRSPSQDVLVAIGLRNGEGDVQEVHLYRISHNGSQHIVSLPPIPLVGTDPKILSFSPDGALLACTVYGYTRQPHVQYYEQVIVHEVEEAGPPSPICTISMNFIEVSARHYSISTVGVPKCLPLSILLGARRDYLNNFLALCQEGKLLHTLHNISGHLSPRVPGPMELHRTYSDRSPTSSTHSTTRPKATPFDNARPNLCSSRRPRRESNCPPRHCRKTLSRTTPSRRSLRRYVCELQGRRCIHRYWQKAN